MNQPPVPTFNLIASAVIGFVGLAWFLTLLYRGFAIASGLRGPRRVSTLVAGVLLAEIVSKLALAGWSRLFTPA